MFQVVQPNEVVQPNGTRWHKLAQVEQVEQVEAGLQIYVEQVEQEQGGLQIDVEQVEQGQGVFPAEPLHLTQSGTTSTRNNYHHFLSFWDQFMWYKPVNYSRFLYGARSQYW